MSTQSSKDEELNNLVTKLENDVESRTVARMAGRTSSNRMIHAQFMTELNDYIQSEKQKAVAEAVRANNELHKTHEHNIKQVAEPEEDL